jgi:tetratricopeptide (TPR) repeat protein
MSETPQADDPTRELAHLLAEARALGEQGKLADAVPLVARALAQAETAFGVDDLRTAATLDHVGWLAAARWQAGEAIAAHRRALAIRDGRLGPSYLETLSAVETLASTIFDVRPMEAHDECLALGLRALAAYEAAGRDDSDLAYFVSELGWRHYWFGRYDEAERLLLRALAMQERLQGPAHPRTGGTARSLAIMYDHSELPSGGADPEPYYRTALVGFESASGDEACGLPDALYRLADYLHRQGRDDDAAPFFERLGPALKDHQAALDPNVFPWLLGGYRAYLQRAGREAEFDREYSSTPPVHPYVGMCQSTAEHAEAAFGPDSLELAEALDHLAMAHAFGGGLMKPRTRPGAPWRSAWRGTAPTPRPRSRHRAPSRTSGRSWRRSRRAERKPCLERSPAPCSSTPSASLGATSAGPT